MCIILHNIVTIILCIYNRCITVIIGVYITVIIMLLGVNVLELGHSFYKDSGSTGKRGGYSSLCSSRYGTGSCGCVELVCLVMMSFIR